MTFPYSDTVALIHTTIVMCLVYVLWKIRVSGDWKQLEGWSWDEQKGFLKFLPNDKSWGSSVQGFIHTTSSITALNRERDLSRNYSFQAAWTSQWPFGSEECTSSLFLVSEVMLDVIHTYLLIYKIWFTLLWKIIKYGKKEISHSTCSKTQILVPDSSVLSSTYNRTHTKLTQFLPLFPRVPKVTSSPSHKLTV